MDYRKFGDTFYIRADRGEEVIATILAVCEKEGIRSAYYNAIGGCSSAEIQTFKPEEHEFDTETVTGMLELVSLMGDIVTNEEGKLYHHTHAMFAYVENGEHKTIGGHLKATTVLYTAEIELRPVQGVIGRKKDPETGTGFWNFEQD